ncbi:hypothetical protein KUTeg_012676 [Tegillarca granosa]|uniref:COP9 signalosome complex subunit 6 n=1 Tax=Tegillarca granosa TaxID=220873 RepID=A0ABQ9F3P4_TEGGR|nr:hypothetical protein KUTeg_012676 [Tegillarca granosa]
MASNMEVDNPDVGVMASAGTSGSVSISLHPLVIMNISEHWTRVKAQEGKPVQVYGALIGKQKGRNIEVMNSFELVTDKVNDAVVSKKNNVFSEMDFLGWYTTGGNPNTSDINVHKQLPVSMYESVIDLVNGEATMLLVELQYTLATEEAERIGVDHVARVSIADSGEGSTGEIPKNHDILREAYSQCNDVCLMAYLGTITKGCNTINQFVNKFNVMYDRQGMGRRMRGLFF